jgi:hypothetical protein
MSASPETAYQPTDLRSLPDSGHIRTQPDSGDDPVKDLESLIPQLPEKVTVAGVPCVVNRVRTRELMLLARVLTRGIGENLNMVDFDGDDAESQIMGLLVVAIPEAGEEVLDLVRALVRPAEKLPDKDPRAGAFHEEMRNPDVDTTLDVLAVLVRQEKETFPLLLGKFRVLFDAASAVWRKERKNEPAAGR